MIRGAFKTNANMVASIKLKKIIIMMIMDSVVVKIYPYSGAFIKHHAALKLI